MLQISMGKLVPCQNNEIKSHGFGAVLATFQRDFGSLWQYKFLSPERNGLYYLQLRYKQNRQINQHENANIFLCFLETIQCVKGYTGDFVNP